MDLLDLAIFVLRLLVVALLYIFLAAVLRLSTRGLRTTPAGPPRLQPAVIGDEPRASRLQLVVLEAGGSSLKPGHVLELTDGAVLGRAETAQVRLLDVAVSSQHARISRVGRAWVLSDLGSTNGTLLNEVPVEGEARLQAGDVLTLGNVRLKVGARKA
jgi:hypothetical protein